MYGLATAPIAFGALATGVIFSGMNIAVARNPEIAELTFTNSLIGFALVETFSFVSITLAVAAHLII